jgi:hypothetical protein
MIENVLLLWRFKIIFGNEYFCEIQIQSVSAIKRTADSRFFGAEPEWTLTKLKTKPSPKLNPNINPNSGSRKNKELNNGELLHQKTSEYDINQLVNSFK